jgi:hypothetical protein
VIPYPRPRDSRARREFAAGLRAERFDGAILLPNAFDAALTVWLARIPERIGYNRDARGLLLTRAIPVPEPGDIPRHERFYYLELLRRAGPDRALSPDRGAIRLEGIEAARESGARHLAALGWRAPVDRNQPRRGLRQRQALAPRSLRGSGGAGRPAHRPGLRLRLRAPAVREVAAALSRSHIEARNLAGRPRCANSSTWPPPAASF